MKNGYDSDTMSEKFGVAVRMHREFGKESLKIHTIRIQPSF